MSFQKFIQKVPMEWQTVQTLIRLLHKEQSDCSTRSSLNWVCTVFQGLYILKPWIISVTTLHYLSHILYTDFHIHVCKNVTFHMKNVLVFFFPLKTLNFNICLNHFKRVILMSTETTFQFMLPTRYCLLESPYRCSKITGKHSHIRKVQ